MRVYEYAKEKGITAKELIAQLQEGGFVVASHMAVLSSEALAYLSKKNNNAKKEKPEKPKTPQVSVPSDEKKSTMIQSQTRAPKQSPVKKIMPKEATHVPLKDVVRAQAEPVASAAPVTHKVIENTVPAPRSPFSRPEMRSEISEEKKEMPAAEPVTVLLQPTVLVDFAHKIGKPFTDVIFTLLKWKILSNKNQLLPIDLIQRLADHYQVTAIRPTVTHEDEVNVRLTQRGVERLPVVVVMGHVDHGKTTLLDFIRKTRVASREKGGITQHLGAYEAKTSQGNIVFLDTPGHEAFSKIRMRGAKVADIAVLVVAADDGVMPQTVEAIKQAKAMGAPIIVAINKIDKVEQKQIDIIRNTLAQQYELMPEDWGGSTIYVPISAKLGTNVDKLLEMIALQAQVMELKADPAAAAKGYALESKVEKGLGNVATFIAQQGTLRVGDYFICGNTRGRVNVLVDSFGVRVAQVGPSTPALVAGFDELPEAGDMFEVVSKDVYLASKKRVEPSRMAPQIVRMSKSEDIKLIVKTDTASSQEALIDGIAKLSKKLERGYAILHAGLGSVSESDLMLAADTGARIVTLHVKTEPNAIQLAQRLGVVIDSYDIIYKLLEHLQQYSDSLKAVKMVLKKVGEALVRKVFDIKDLGVIAGCYIKEGIFTRTGSVVIWRGARKVGAGAITSLQRDRRSVKEVHAGFECAFMVEGFTEWEVDDRVECFAEKPESA